MRMSNTDSKKCNLSTNSLKQEKIFFKTCNIVRNPFQRTAKFRYKKMRNDSKEVRMRHNNDSAVNSINYTLNLILRQSPSQTT